MTKFLKGKMKENLNDPEYNDFLIKHQGHDPWKK
jgi:hypothetical protein